MYNVSIRATLDAISPPGGAIGAIMASPSKNHPDYFYHWIRDSAVTMDALATLLNDARTPSERTEWIRVLGDCAAFSASLQRATGPFTSLGEPKWNMDGSPFTLDWGRPQNDGPASRASALTKFAQFLNHQYINTTHLYDPNNPNSRAAIQVDLEYVVRHWREPSYDIWEEVAGTHFYTLMAQRRALLDGALIAEKLEDFSSAARYTTQAKAMDPIIRTFWDPKLGYLRTTLNRTAGLDYKTSNLDVQVILASLHASLSHDAFMVPESDEIISTLVALIIRFTPLYPINRVREAPGAPGDALAPGIGRYPEDKYNGYDSKGQGNPWMLTTTAMAETLYRIRQAWQRAGRIPLTPATRRLLSYLSNQTDVEIVGMGEWDEIQKGKDPRWEGYLNALKDLGDAFLRRVRYHSPKDLAQSEQWNRHTGFQQGAPHLTWSHVSFLSAIRVRRHIVPL
ncbi:Six-hairpin glycosidase-like protein [Piptocephalis cylindrospora]|uniref:glucan 1,4-alpha-glucosidase n=1 Tax=Piptocephalis cylindrospora TaxID=1907219 RepID=A0A4P9Y879_9FUNG|nr:Six-hairpin glycosidase-like protein [Piptocephalis cylindrospora]|eukprot:RKP14521.1 Six-hairpin glycosidase-like protein [Piptocephalis cylindrospora]